MEGVAETAPNEHLGERAISTKDELPEDLEAALRSAQARARLAVNQWADLMRLGSQTAEAGSLDSMLALCEAAVCGAAAQKSLTIR